MGDAGIVDEDVEAAEPARRVGDHAPRVGRPANIHLEHDRAATESTHRAGRVLRRQQIGAGDVGALSRQRERNGAPDTARRAGDEGDPARERNGAGGRMPTSQATRASHPRTSPNGRSQPSSSISMWACPAASMYSDP